VLCPGPQAPLRTPLGSLQRSPDFLAVLRGPTSKGKGEGREKGRRKEDKGREGKGPPFANSWIRPMIAGFFGHRF